MNADLKRVRDTALEDGPSPATKKRATALSAPSPMRDDEEEKEEDWMKIVEVKQKEAIYRQMLEYRRFYEREAEKTAQLEVQRRVLEASVHAVELCWQQVLQAVRDLTGDATSDSGERTLLDPESIQPELEKEVRSRASVTQGLVKSFVDLAARNGLRPLPSAELQSRCSKLQADADSHRQNARMLQSQLRAVIDTRDQIQKDLARAEKRLDRQGMDHDRAVQDLRDEDRQAANATPRPNGSGNVTPNGKIEEDVKPFDAAGAAQAASNLLLQDTTELEQLAATRLRQLEQFQSEHAALRQEADQLRQAAMHPSETALREAPFFQVYLHQLSSHYNRANALQERYSATERKLDELRDSNFEFREAVIAEAKQEADALRQQGTKKDADLVRLRGQRDELQADQTERKLREAERSRYAEEVEGLAKAREERIVFLVSEVKRLRGNLGAESGSRGYLGFLHGEGGVDGDYVEDLETKLAEAHGRIAALSSDVAEVQLREEHGSLRQSLERYERILGPQASADLDVQSVAKRLEQLEAEKSKLQMRVEEAEAGTNAVYTELEGVSKLWEGVEHTLRTKVFELKDAELKWNRLSTEKAKADNKFFAAMRAKEALDIECKTAQRTVEKQLKMLEKSQEVERGLNAQIAAQEKTLTSVKNSHLDNQSQLATVTSEKSQLELRLQQTQAQLNDAQQIMQQRVAEAVAEKAAKDRIQEELDKATSSIKKLNERQEVANTTNATVGEIQLKDERDKLMKLLRCGCCQQNFKQQMINRCGHVFCKPCIDARVLSRQRKCPTCGVAFAKEDVQQVYW